MSLSADVQSKKRKKSLATGADMDEPHAKKSRKDKEKKHKKKDKGNTKGNAGEFRVVKASLVVSIPPVFASNPRAGVEEMLDSIVMRYVPALQGVVLVHSNLRFLEQKAAIKADCPYAVCPVGFDATVWSPTVGMKLVARVNLCSPDHISLLVHRTFNVSIPRHHIPTDNWEFEYGPAENDPEFGPHAVREDANGTMDVGDNQNEDDTHEIEGGGRWVHKVTGERLGGPERQLEFTVIGLTVANNMLSLIGSIQPDPFSQYHVPTSATSTHPEAEDVEEVAGVEEVIAELNENDDSDEDDDPFTKLGKMGDAAKRKAKAEQAEKASEQKKEKRKRKDENAGAESKQSKKKKKT